MTTALLKARLNLNAVLRNLEVLPELDSEAAAIVRSWRIAIRFHARGAGAVVLTFDQGKASFDPLGGSPADVCLYFVSPAHLNAMFAGTSSPLPLRGITRLRFLQTEFPRIVKRLEYFLKPAPETPMTDAYMRINTALTLYTAAFAVPELGRLDAVARGVMARMPSGALQIGILPDGPHAGLIFDGKGGTTVRRGAVENPRALLCFRGVGAASALFSGKLDAVGAVASGDLMLRGWIPMIDNLNLILDRIPLYLR